VPPEIGERLKKLTWFTKGLRQVCVFEVCAKKLTWFTKGLRPHHSQWNRRRAEESFIILCLLGGAKKLTWFTKGLRLSVVCLFCILRLYKETDLIYEGIATCLRCFHFHFLLH